MDHLLRVAIWEAHGRRCAYTGDPVRFADVQIDHIVPQHLRHDPDELGRVLAALRLRSDFDLDGLENLLPCSGRANRSKGGSVADLRTAHAMELARSKVQEIKAVRNKLEREDQLQLYRLHMSLALEQGKLTYEDVRKIIHELETNPSIVRLNQPIRFARGEQMDRLTRLDVDALLDKAILPRQHGLERLTLGKEDGQTCHVYTARQWLQARVDGFHPVTNYDVKEQAFFLHVGAVAWAIKNKQPSETSFVSEVGVSFLDLLPPLVLPHLSGDQRRALLELEARGETVGSILRSNGIAAHHEAGCVSFEYQAMHKSIWELARGNFSGTGHEEILVHEYERTLQGTYAVTGVILLSRTQSVGSFQSRDIGIPDLQTLLT